ADAHTGLIVARHEHRHADCRGGADGERDYRGGYREPARPRQPQLLLHRRRLGRSVRAYAQRVGDVVTETVAELVVSHLAPPAARAAARGLRAGGTGPHPRLYPSLRRSRPT